MLVVLCVSLPASAEDRLAAGESVRVEAPVEGDLAVAGRQVAIAAPVAGYALAAGRNVEVSGSVADDLWAAGATVVLDAPVGDNALLAGREVRLQDKAEVAGDVRVAARSVSLAPGALIRGDLIVHGAGRPRIDPGAQVLGQIRVDEASGTESTWAGWLTSWFFWFLALMAVGFAALALFPAWTGRVARAMRERPVVSALTGLAGLVLTPLAAVLLATTVVGIPLALVLLAFYVIAIVLAGALVAYRLGGWLLGRGTSRPWPRMALGALAVSLVISLPWIGSAAQLLVLITGFGALMLERWAATRQSASPVT